MKKTVLKVTLPIMLLALTVSAFAQTGEVSDLLVELRPTDEREVARTALEGIDYEGLQNTNRNATTKFSLDNVNVAMAIETSLLNLMEARDTMLRLGKRVNSSSANAVVDVARENGVVSVLKPRKLLQLGEGFVYNRNQAQLEQAAMDIEFLSTTPSDEVQSQLSVSILPVERFSEEELATAGVVYDSCQKLEVSKIKGCVTDSSLPSALAGTVVLLALSSKVDYQQIGALVLNGEDSHALAVFRNFLEENVDAIINIQDLLTSGEGSERVEQLLPEAESRTVKIAGRAAIKASQAISWSRRLFNKGSLDVTLRIASRATSKLVTKMSK